MDIKQYLNEIWDIAHENDVDIGVGKDMFLANVRNANDKSLPHYAGADHVDYAALLPHYKELEDSVNEYNAAVLEHYNAIVELRKDGKRDEAVALLW